jgi:nicotinamide-nucleotide amidase
MKAEIISVGTELLLGELADTNTSFIAGQLAMLGIDLHHASLVGDNRERLLAALRQARQRADLIITTGGLGPTQDDITREAIAGLLEEEPAVDPALKQDLIDYFARRGIEMPENNIRQAVLIPSAVGLPNLRGTAPGWWAEKEGKVIVALPGPPPELQAMWQREVYPRLEKMSSAVIISRTIKTWGVGEAKVDEMTAPVLSAKNPTVGIYSKQDGIHLRITAKAAEKETARKMIARPEAEIRRILGDNIWGTDEETLEGILGQLLIKKGLTLAVAESFTGGLLSYTFASAPESERFFRGGIILGGGEARTAFGLKSPPLAGRASDGITAKMASIARTELGADIGFGIDGYAEPSVDISTGKIFVAIDAGKSSQSVTHNYSGRPHQIVRRAVQSALFDLYRVLR